MTTGSYSLGRGDLIRPTTPEKKQPDRGSVVQCLSNKLAIQETARKPGLLQVKCKDVVVSNWTTTCFTDRPVAVVTGAMSGNDCLTVTRFSVVIGLIGANKPACSIPARACAVFVSMFILFVIHALSAVVGK